MPEWNDDLDSLLRSLDRTINNGLKESVFDTRQMVRTNTETINRIEDGMQEIDRKLEVFMKTRELTCPHNLRKRDARKIMIQTWLGPIITGVIVGGALLLLGS